MKAVIILPTYNERENITAMLNALLVASQKIKGYTFEVLVVDDNSPDGTQKEVEKFQKTHKHIHILSGKKEGLGKALLRGMTYAIHTLGADILVQMDADLSHDPASLPHLFDKLAAGADFVIGSRYVKGGSIPSNWGIHRKIYSKVGNAIVRYGLGFPKIHDWTGGFRVIRKKYFEEARTKVAKYSGYVFQMAFLYTSILNGAVVAEVPIQFTDRRFGHSKIAPLEYIVNIYLYIFTERTKRMISHQFIRFGMVGTVGFIINTAVLELFVAQRLHPAMGSATGAELAIISNFIFNNRWTFGDRKVSGLGIIPKFLQFNLTSLGALAIQTSCVWLGTTVWGHGVYFISYIAGVGIGLVWNYTMYSRVIWKKQHHQ